MNLGRAITLCRKQKGMTQAELASQAGISISYLSLLEQNKRIDPTLSTLQKLAGAIGVPTGILFYLAADRAELDGLDADLAQRLSHTALLMLSEPKDDSSSLFTRTDSKS